MLTRELRNLFPRGNDRPPILDYYETRVFRCDENGGIRNREYVWFKKEYADLEKARAGHKETVDMLMERKLPLEKQRLYPDISDMGDSRTTRRSRRG